MAPLAVVVLNVDGSVEEKQLDSKERFRGVFELLGGYNPTLLFGISEYEVVVLAPEQSACDAKRNKNQDPIFEQLDVKGNIVLMRDGKNFHMLEYLAMKSYLSKLDIEKIISGEDESDEEVSEDDVEISDSSSSEDDAMEVDLVHNKEADIESESEGDEDASDSESDSVSESDSDFEGVSDSDSSGSDDVDTYVVNYVKKLMSANKVNAVFIDVDGKPVDRMIESVEKALGSKARLVGQYENGVNVFRMANPKPAFNRENRFRLPNPFSDEQILGEIVLVKTDAKGKLLDFSLQELQRLQAENGDGIDESSSEDSEFSDGDAGYESDTIVSIDDILESSAVLIDQEGAFSEVRINTHLPKEMLEQKLGGKVSYVCHYENGISVLSIRKKGGNNKELKNKITLPYPHHDKRIKGDILLVNVGTESEKLPLDFVVSEAREWLEGCKYSTSSSEESDDDDEKLELSSSELDNESDQSDSDSDDDDDSCVPAEFASMITSMLKAGGPIVDIVVIDEDGQLHTHTVDMSPMKDSVSATLGGAATIIGQYKNGVVALKLKEPEKGKHKMNKASLPPPMHEENVYGPILLTKMDKNSEPVDFARSDFEQEFGEIALHLQPSDVNSDCSDSEFDESDAVSGESDSESNDDDGNCVPPEFANMIQNMLKTNGPIVNVIVVAENGKMQEEKVDMSPTKDAVSVTLGGSATFIGQYENGVVALKLREPEKGKHQVNKMKLPSPMHEEEVHGPILLIKMGKNSEPLDFTISDFKAEFGVKRGNKKPKLNSENKNPNRFYASPVGCN